MSHIYITFLNISIFLNILSILSSIKWQPTRRPLDAEIETQLDPSVTWQDNHNIKIRKLIIQLKLTHE